MFLPELDQFCISYANEFELCGWMELIQHLFFISRCRSIPVFFELMDMLIFNKQLLIIIVIFVFPLAPVFSMGNNAYGQCGRKIIEDEVYRLVS